MQRNPNILNSFHHKEEDTHFPENLSKTLNSPTCCDNESVKQQTALYSKEIIITDNMTKPREHFEKVKSQGKKEVLERGKEFKNDKLSQEDYPAHLLSAETVASFNIHENEWEHNALNEEKKGDTYVYEIFIQEPVYSPEEEHKEDHINLINVSKSEEYEEEKVDNIIFDLGKMELNRYLFIQQKPDRVQTPINLLTPKSTISNGQSNQIQLSQVLLRSKLNSLTRSKTSQDTFPLAPVKQKFAPNSLIENFLLVGTNVNDILELHSMDTMDQESLDSTSNERPKYSKGRVMFDFAKSMSSDRFETPLELEDLLPSSGLVANLYERDSEYARASFCKAMVFEGDTTRERFVYCFMPHTKDILLSEWEEYAGALNSQKRLYAACIKKTDYLVVDYENLNDGKQYFVEIDTIYCVLTYCPIVQICFNMLDSIINKTLEIRKELFRKHKDQALMDFKIMNSLLSNELNECLKMYSQLAAPSPNAIIKYGYHNHNNKLLQYQYTCPIQASAYLELVMWEARRIFSMFSLQDINFLINSILLEQHVVFFSSSKTLLSTALNTILSLIYPLEYPYNIISTYTADLIEIFGFFQPFIVCVNEKEEYFWDLELDDYPHTYVFLDSRTIYVERSRNNSKADLSSRLDFLIEGLENQYMELNRDKTCFNRIFSHDVLIEQMRRGSRGSAKEKSLLVVSQNNMAVKEFFECFFERMEKTIVSNIRLFDKLDRGNWKREKIEKKIQQAIKDNRIKEFFYYFQETLLFGNYP